MRFTGKWNNKEYSYLIPHQDSLYQLISTVYINCFKPQNLNT